MQSVQAQGTEVNRGLLCDEYNSLLVCRSSLETLQGVFITYKFVAVSLICLCSSNRVNNCASSVVLCSMLVMWFALFIYTWANKLPTLFSMHINGQSPESLVPAASALFADDTVISPLRSGDLCPLDYICNVKNLLLDVQERSHAKHQKTIKTVSPFIYHVPSSYCTAILQSITRMSLNCLGFWPILEGWSDLGHHPELFHNNFHSTSTYCFLLSLL